MVDPHTQVVATFIYRRMFPSGTIFFDGDSEQILIAGGEDEKMMRAEIFDIATGLM